MEIVKSDESYLRRFIPIESCRYFICPVARYDRAKIAKIIMDLQTRPKIDSVGIIGASIEQIMHEPMAVHISGRKNSRYLMGFASSDLTPRK